MYVDQKSSTIVNNWQRNLLTTVKNGNHVPPDSPRKGRHREKACSLLLSLRETSYGEDNDEGDLKTQLKTSTSSFTPQILFLRIFIFSWSLHNYFRERQFMNQWKSVFFWSLGKIISIKMASIYLFFIGRSLRKECILLS